MDRPAGPFHSCPIPSEYKLSVLMLKAFPMILCPPLPLYPTPTTPPLPPPPFSWFLTDERDFVAMKRLIWNPGDMAIAPYSTGKSKASCINGWPISMDLMDLNFPSQATHQSQSSHIISVESMGDYQH